MLNKFENWNRLINRIPSTKLDIYFIPENYELYALLGDGEPRCFSFEKDNEIAIYPFLINSINALGYQLDQQYFDIQGSYGYNGVLSTSNDPEFIESFYHAFELYCKQNNIIAEFTRFHPLLDNFEFSKENMQIILDRETVALDLSKEYEEIWNNEFTSKNRNMIRKARKLGYTSKVLTAPTPEEIEEFKEIYRNSMNNVKADGYYYFNDAYFENIFTLFRDNIYLLNVYNADGVAICSSIFLIMGNFIHYHLSGRKEFTDNSINNFLLDEAIQYAKTTDAICFHFGGGKTSSQDDSLLKFKASFSKMRKNFYIGKKVHNQSVYNEVVAQWENKFPEKMDLYKHFVLKYRN